MAENLIIFALAALFFKESQRHEALPQQHIEIKEVVLSVCEPKPCEKLRRQPYEGRDPSVSDAMLQPDICSAPWLR